MAETDNRHGTEAPDIPQAVPVQRSRRTVQLVWLIPLIAALVGGWLAVKAVLDRGPTITISFDTAEGLEAGKTKLKFKDVDVGLVSSITVTKDLKGVIVTADLAKGSEPGLVEDTRFWVVRPRIAGGSVSGLGTLLSGVYIGIDIGKSSKSSREFIGLKQPPAIQSDVPGRMFVLHSDDMGSLDFGSPVFFRRIQVGQVASYELDKDGKGVTLKVFVNSPYEQFVTPNTRFWHASGIDVALDANGIKVETQSMVAILLGGLAFETPVESVGLPPAAAESELKLFANRTEAMKNPEMGVMKFVLVFNESVRGLAVGAPLDFRGIEIGTVTAIKVELEEAAKNIAVVVEADLYPARLRSRLVKEFRAWDNKERLAMLNGMIAHGLRGQLRTGNLLTGQMYIALDFFHDAPKAKIGVVRDRIELPTMESSMRELQATIASIAKKIEALPLEQISADLHVTLENANKVIDTDLRQTLQTATKMMQGLDTEIIPEAHEALVSAERLLKPDSPLSHDAREAMREIARTAEAFRVLADYLEQHPEALLSGKNEEKK